MKFHHWAILSICILTLSGCFRQSSDSFEDVNSVTVESSPIVSNPSNQVATIPPVVVASSTPLLPPVTVGTIIRSLPTRTPAPPTNTLDATGLAQQNQPTNTPIPTATDENALPPITLLPTRNSVIEATDTPIPPDVTLAPTPTRVTYITPDQPNQVEVPTVIPTTPSAEEMTALADVGIDLRELVTEAPTATPIPLTAIPARCKHEIQSGDTLSRIALIYDTTIEALQERNDIQNPILQIGQVLLLPECDFEATDEPTVPPSATSTQAPISPSSGVIHVVQIGETMGEIAQQYGVTVSDLLIANGLTDPNRLSIGQELLIP